MTKINFGGKRGGKSFQQALKTADLIRAGSKVGLAYRDPETSELRVDPILSVPGFPDGTQLPSPGETTIIRQWLDPRTGALQVETIDPAELYAQPPGQPHYTEFEKGERAALLQIRSFITKHGVKELDAYCAQRLHDIKMDRLHWQKQEEEKRA